MHNVLRYGVWLILLVVLVVFWASICFEKWIGLELIQTYQSVFFILSLAQGFPFEFSAITENVKYTNGYDDSFSSEYEQVYTFPSNLIALSKQKEFLSNYNINFILIFISIIVMIVLALFKRKYKLMLEEYMSSQIKKKQKKVDTIFSFVFSCIFMILIFFSMFEIIFSFCIQLSNHSVLY